MKNSKSKNTDIDFIPSQHKGPPPTKYLGKEDGKDVYTWYITEDEYLRLNKIFGREFQEVDLGGTQVRGLPSPCSGCGKYTEFIDWVWTALKRGVHSSDFIFEALRDSRQGRENMHDVYCSECGVLTACRSRDNAEGGAPNISLAGVLDRTGYPVPPDTGAKTKGIKNAKVVTWGKWWLDDNGSTAEYQAARRRNVPPVVPDQM